MGWTHLLFGLETFWVRDIPPEIFGGIYGQSHPIEKAEVARPSSTLSSALATRGHREEMMSGAPWLGRTPLRGRRTSEPGLWCFHEENKVERKGIWEWQVGPSWIKWPYISLLSSGVKKAMLFHIPIHPTKQKTGLTQSPRPNRELERSHPKNQRQDHPTPPYLPTKCYIRLPSVLRSITLPRMS